MEVIGQGVVYTETTVYSAPEKYSADAPYQLAIIEGANARRITVRILGSKSKDHVQIGDAVEFAEERDGVAYYRKITERTEAASDPARAMER